MTDTQITEVREALEDRLMSIEGLHHGDCVGADAQFHDLCVDLGLGDLIIIHPPENDKWRAFKEAPVIRIETDYHARNRSIVSSSDLILAAPVSRVKKGGTWYTIRYAKSRHTPCCVFLPEGFLADDLPA